MMTSRNTDYSAVNNNRFDQMNDVQAEELIRIEPQNVIVFYRNQFQSASTIKITKNKSFKEVVRFQLKTTNKASYLVSQSSGQILANQNSRYVNILINEQVPLQHCLHDKFKLLIIIPGKPPIEKKFKVIIQSDYKKQIPKGISKELQRLQVVSKTSGNGTTINPSILGHPLVSVKKSMLKKSQLVSYLGSTNESDRVNIKQELDEIVKKVQQKRGKLEFLQKEIQKNKSRQRFMVYVSLLAMIGALLIGIVLKRIIVSGLGYAKMYQM